MKTGNFCFKVSALAFGVYFSCAMRASSAAAICSSAADVCCAVSRPPCHCKWRGDHYCRYTILPQGSLMYSLLPKASASPILSTAWTGQHQAYTKKFQVSYIAQLQKLHFSYKEMYLSPSNADEAVVRILCILLNICLWCCLASLPISFWASLFPKWRSMLRTARTCTVTSFLVWSKCRITWIALYTVQRQ